MDIEIAESKPVLCFMAICEYINSEKRRTKMVPLLQMVSFSKGHSFFLNNAPRGTVSVLFFLSVGMSEGCGYLKCICSYNSGILHYIGEDVISRHS